MPLSDPYAPHLEELDRQAGAMRSLLEAWCAQNSGSAHAAGLARMREILAAAFAPLGGRVERLEADPVTDLRGIQQRPGGALRIRKHPEAPIQVVLSGHMDTVYGADSPFQTCREIRPGVLNGPGVADMKGGLVVMLKVLETLERSPWAGRLGWTVLIVGDEETGSLGSERIIAETAAGQDLALVFECAQAGGATIGRRKGIGSFIARARGREAHTGRDFSAGRNAIVLLAEFVLGLHQLNERYPGFSINVGLIRGGTATNIVPGAAEADINLRIPPGADPAALLAEIETLRAPLAARDGFELRFEGRVLRAALDLTRERSAWIAALQETAAAEGLELPVMDSGGGSDGNAFFAHGVPVLDGIALRGGHLHSPQEFVELDSLVERARLISRLLLRLAAGERLRPGAAEAGPSRPS